MQTIGLDIAKRTFQVHSVNLDTKELLKVKLHRQEVLPFFANQRSCIVTMEACASAHHWARKLSS